MSHAAHPALEAERERAQREKYAALTAHYGEIGPAALLGALACLQRKPEPEPEPETVKPVSQAA